MIRLQSTTIQNYYKSTPVSKCAPPPCHNHMPSFLHLYILSPLPLFLTKFTKIPTLVPLFSSHNLLNFHRNYNYFYLQSKILNKMGSDGNDYLSLDSIRKTLIELEDTIIYSLIERAKLPLNSLAYDSSPFPGFHGSLMEFLVKGTESVQAQGGRYQSPEEVPFFPNSLSPPLVHRPLNCSQDLPPATASVNVSKNIWDFYVNQFLPLLAAKGDDGNYAISVAADLACLQVISRRIHFGKYVAEVKFRSETEAYSAAIRAKDKDTLTNLLTDNKVEEMVKQRVEKKATVFGQEVTLNDTSNTNNYKVDPSLVSRLYDQWVIPLTKDVEVEYLLRRLD